MKKIFASLVLVCFLYACSGENSYKKATDAQDAGREFIRASLDGNMKKASFYLLRDSVNDYFFNKWRDQYNKLSPEEKKLYHDAQIRPIQIENVNDSTVNYVFTNSYKQKDTTQIRVIRQSGEWLIDLKEIGSNKRK
jgi:hypothetical protein